MVHDDAQLIVVDKAAGVLTVPTQRRERNTLVDLVTKHIRREALVVHRLDRDTSGLLVFAKDQRTLRALVEAWSTHERVYAAIVHGVVGRDDGRVESRLITERNLDRRSVDNRRREHNERDDRKERNDHEGERAVTFYRVVERVAGATLLEVTLETGRRNQIRVHMKDLGHPILGDDRYARHTPPHALWRGGLALHARKLAFVHPTTGARVALDAGMPLAFTRFLDVARKKGRS